MAKSDDKTRKLLEGMVVRERRALLRRQARMARTVNAYAKRMDNGDLKSLEDALYPIIGRIEVLGE